ncbi:hypothetical protein JXZ92_00090 [Mycoplasma sp. CSL10137]|uniref:hypothetical protein n=1 Tax=unclassified Mycoplasma TaxID=2683645 RepID=UPI00197BBDCE|nr:MULTISPECIES: hypothetical protein [unclassified Mycoplasma]MBN4083221.1 hypothetical protein [Mycoplasma sp. CSL10137]MBU4692962.1 hypothetical protein [Mycoplasma sp. CSL7491-lung]
MKKKLFFWSFISILTLPIVLSSSISVNNKTTYLKKSLSHIDGPEINVSDYLATDWMKDIPDNRSLFSLSIPGTHDSTMYNGWGFLWSIGGRLLAKTQYFNFEDQLKLGVRAFDLRMQNDGRLVHGSIPSDQFIDKAFQEYVKFLNEHPSEFIIVRIKDENFNVNNEKYAKEANQIYQKTIFRDYYDYIYNQSGENVDTLSKEKGFNIGQYRGKIIVLNHLHHKINRDTVGGFHFRAITDNYVVQDKYDGINSSEEKVKHITDHFQRTNNKGYRDNRLYVNFTSYASGRQPNTSSNEVNQKVADYINNHNELSTLGVVFSDFPGPSLIQSIYRTNFNYTDTIINNNVLGPLVNSLHFDKVYDRDNKITLITSDNPKSYQNLHIEFDIDGNLISKVIPSEYNSNKFEINIENQLKHPQIIKVSAYKMTPNDGWFAQRKYNEINIDLPVETNQFIIKRNELIDVINKLKIDYGYNKNYSSIVRYLNDKFSIPLENIKNNDNLKLAELTDNFNSIKNQINQELLLLNNIDDNLLILNTKRDQINNIFSNQKITEINNLKNNIIEKINSLFNNRVNYISSSEMNNLFLETLKKDEISKIVPKIIDEFNKYNFKNLKLDFKKENPDFNFAKEHWNNKINETLLIPDEIISKIQISTSVDEVNLISKQEYNHLKEKAKLMQDNINSARKNIVEIKNFLSSDGNFIFKDFFRNEIIDNISNLESSNLIIELVNSYKLKLSELKQEVKKAEEYDSKNSSFNNLNNRNFQNTLNEIKNKINEPNSLLDLDYINNKKEEIVTLLQKAKKSNNLYSYIIKRINDSDKLYEEWKEKLVSSLNNIFDVNESNLANFIKKLDNLEEENFLYKLSNLEYLNFSQKSHLSGEMKKIIDIDALKNKLNDASLLNKKMNQLNQLFYEFSNYDLEKGYGLLEYEKQVDFSNKYNEIKQKISRDIDIKTVNSYINFLNNYMLIFNGEKVISNLRDRIAKSNKLYEFEKNNLNTILSNVDNSEKLQEIKDQISILEEKNIKNNDENIFKQLSNEQRKNALYELNNSVNEENYLSNKQKYLNLDNSIIISEELFKNIEKIKLEDRFLNNYDEIKDNLLNKVSELREIYKKSNNYIEIEEKIRDINYFLSKLEDESIKFKHENSKDNIVISEDNNSKENELDNSDKINDDNLVTIDSASDNNYNDNNSDKKVDLEVPNNGTNETNVDSNGLDNNKSIDKNSNDDSIESINKTKNNEFKDQNSSSVSETKKILPQKKDKISDTNSKKTEKEKEFVINSEFKNEVRRWNNSYFYLLLIPVGLFILLLNIIMILKRKNKKKNSSL